MMKKQTKYAIFIIVIAIVLIALTTIFILSNYNYYKLSPTICELTIGEKPEDFVKSRGRESLLVNGYTFASLDDDGNLILILSDKEVEAWKKSSLSLEILRIVTNDTVDLGIEGDYVPENWLEEITIDSAKRTEFNISDDFTKITYDMEGSRIISGSLVNACAMMQLFEGRTGDDFRVEEIMYDDNDNIIVHNLWTSEKAELK